MAFPTITGIEGIEDFKPSRLTIRREAKGTLATLIVPGIGPKPTGEVVIAGEKFILAPKGRERNISSNRHNSTIYHLRPAVHRNRLAWMEQEAFLKQIEGLIKPVYARGEGDDIVFDHSQSSWTARMSYWLEGSPDHVSPYQQERIQVGGRILQVLNRDLVETTDGGEIGFQEAVEVLEDYILGVTVDGVIYEVDNTDLYNGSLSVHSARLTDDNIDYSLIPIACVYTDRMGEEVEIVRGAVPVGGTDADYWHVDQIMPNIGQAILEINLQRRRLARDARTGRFVTKPMPDLTPRHHFTYDGDQYKVIRAITTWSARDHDRTEVEAWREN